MGFFGFGKKDTTQAIFKGPWDVYTYVYGQGQRAMVTFDGAMRDVVFQCQDPAAFAAGFEAWKTKTNPSTLGRVELVARDGGWALFDEKIRPKPEHWEWIQNARVVRGLLEHGADENAEHRLDHFFVGPHPALAELANILAERACPTSARARPASP